MDRKERIKTEITTNTLNYLTSKFDDLLCGIDTKKYYFEDKREKERKIKSIKSFICYRFEEKVIDNKSELWSLILKINNSTLSLKKQIESFYLALLKLRYHELEYSKPLRLRYPKSNYYIQKAKEASKKEGEKIIARFFKIFDN